MGRPNANRKGPYTRGCAVTRGPFFTRPSCIHNPGEAQGGLWTCLGKARTPLLWGLTKIPAQLLVWTQKKTSHWYKEAILWASGGKYNQGVLIRRRELWGSFQRARELWARTKLLSAKKLHIHFWNDSYRQTVCSWTLPGWKQSPDMDLSLESPELP